MLSASSSVKIDICHIQPVFSFPCRLVALNIHCVIYSFGHFIHPTFPLCISPIPLFSLYRGEKRPKRKIYLQPNSR